MKKRKLVLNKESIIQLTPKDQSSIEGGATDSCWCITGTLSITIRETCPGQECYTCQPGEMGPCDFTQTNCNG